MERINGYLVIDNYQRVVADKDKEQYWVYINGEEYYFKQTSAEDDAYNELIAYHGARLLGVDGCYYDLATLNGKKGVISKSLRKPGEKLVSGEVILGDYLVSSIQKDSETITAIDIMVELGLDKKTAKSLKKCYFSDNPKHDGADEINTLEVLYYALKERYKDKININKVMEQIIKMYFFDILFNQRDRHTDNYIFIESLTNVKLASIFDNEKIFNHFFNSIIYVSFNDFNRSWKESIIYFLKNAPQKYIIMFLKMFIKLITNFKNIIKAVEDQIGGELPRYYKDSLIGNYKRHINTLGNIINEHIGPQIKVLGGSKKRYKIKPGISRKDKKTIFAT